MTVGLALCAAASAAEPPEFVLLRRSGPAQLLRITAITDRTLAHADALRGMSTIELSQCLALLSPSVTVQHSMAPGMLRLADGQRLPGEPAKPPGADAGAADGASAPAAPVTAAQGDTLAWNHPWLGRLDIPLGLIQSVTFVSDRPPPAPGMEDVVLLANGDRQEGFIKSMGASVAMEVGRGGAEPRRQVIHIPLRLVAAVTMVTKPQQSSGMRIWFNDQTVLDVESLSVGEGGQVRLAGPALSSGTPAAQVNLSHVAAVLLNPQSLVALASLPPARVEGPATRFTLPRPRIVDPGAPLGLSPIEFSGPVVARYVLPADCERFSAEAELPVICREWGDCELIVRIDDAEVFRSRLNSERPRAALSVAVGQGADSGPRRGSEAGASTSWGRAGDAAGGGRELTIEVAQGAHGPIQDQVILHRAMLVMKR